MATKKSTAKLHPSKAPSRDAVSHEPHVTPEQQRKAQDYCIQNGAYAKPPSTLVNDDPAETVATCRRVVDWLASAEQTAGGADMALAEMHVLQSVVDALRHVELQIAGYWNVTKGGAA